MSDTTLTQDDIDEIVNELRESALNAAEPATWASYMLMMEVVPSLLSWITKIQERGLLPNEGLGALIVCQAKMTAILTDSADVAVPNDELVNTVTKVYADILREELVKREGDGVIWRGAIQ